MRLDHLRRPSGARKGTKRVGRGPGSGHGKTSGRGHKGQGSRSGGNVAIWFEGGQMPLQRRIPKRGFTNIFRKVYAIVNVGDLERLADGQEVSPEVLHRAGCFKRRHCGLKVLGGGDVTQPLTVKAHAFSRSALEKIEAAGGRVVVV